MCERCADDSFVRSEPLDESEDAECIWPLDDEGAEFCMEPAEVLVFERTVDAHLCPTCMNAYSGALDDGLGDLLRVTGLGATNDFLPITETEPCDRCGMPAKFAWVSISARSICAAHAEENGWLPGVP